MKGLEHYREKIQQLIAEEAAWACGAESSARYAQISDSRFDVVTELAARLAPGPQAHVLDIGRSELTRRLSQRFENLCTLGFPLETDEGGHRETSPLPRVSHIVCDLNLCDNVATWPDCPGRFDLVVCSEVVEHLTSAPEFALLMLSYLTKPGGSLLVTTPNAATLKPRLNLLRGRQPYERLRRVRSNPGHVREYTLRELIAMGSACDLEVTEARTAHLGHSRQHPILSRLVYAVPGWRPQIVVVYRNPDLGT